ncbi:tail fiber protein [Nibrella viscosa]|uniref:Tail fiber protein n=2 Tax=Nibrella viscosa TaxID=1084524 RepID=A0ABP8JRL4_9BACT
MFCEGQLLPISENEVLFQLIGTSYGGDGQNTFALPDLRGRVPLHQGNGLILAQTGGTESVTLTVNQIPSHAHTYTYQPVASSNGGTQTSPQGAYYAFSGRQGYYAGISAINTNMADISSTNSVQTGVVGGSQPFDNMQPYLTVSYIISLFGIFPSPT